MELKSGDLLFDQRRKNGEDESAKRSNVELFMVDQKE